MPSKEPVAVHPFWLTFAVALAASLLLTPVARTIASRLGFVDCPDGRRKLQKEPVPLLGGFAIYCALVIGLMVAGTAAPEYASSLRQLGMVIMAAAGFVCLLGAIDDVCDLRPRLKLLLQVFSISPVVFAGYSIDRVVVFGVPIELGWLGIPITVLWLVGCINALNLLDGMDGLASVVGLATSLMIAVLAANTGHPHVAAIAMVLSGALTGFLIYNLPPASIYLGDCGSMIIGLVIGILSIQAALKTSATLSLTAPAVALAVPMLDTALAIVRRRLTGARFDAADRGHIHHRLLDRGLTHWQALCIIGALCLATGAAATAATLLSFDALGWLTMLAIVALLVRTRAFGHHELALVKLSLAAMLTRLVHRLIDSTSPALRKERHPPMRFEPAWNALAEELSQWKVHRLEMTIERGEVESDSRVWIGPAAPKSAKCVWWLEMQFKTKAGSCRLKIGGVDQTHAEPWYLLRMSRLLKEFGQHWAARLDQITIRGGETIALPHHRAPQAKAA